MSFITVAVIGSQAFGQLQQGKYAQGQANLNASQLDYRAQVEQHNALQAAQVIRRAGRRQVGQAVAAYAGAGVKVGEGSALEVEGQIGREVEHDAFQTLLEGDLRALGLRTDATMERIGGRMQRSASTVAAVNTVLSGGYNAMRANGWRTGGPGFSGQQKPAPVEDRSTRPFVGYGGRY
jgi:hypothetical protein